MSRYILIGTEWFVSIPISFTSLVVETTFVFCNLIVISLVLMEFSEFLGLYLFSFYWQSFGFELNYISIIVLFGQNIAMSVPSLQTD